MKEDEIVIGENILYNLVLFVIYLICVQKEGD